MKSTKDLSEGVPRDLTGYGTQPPPSPWAEGTKVVVSIGVNIHEGAEMSIAEGDPAGESNCEGMLVEAGAREFAIETFFEYGARCGAWRLLRDLEAFSVQATFFCCGQALERNPELARRIGQRHEVACHGWRYVSYYGIGDDDQMSEIERSRKAVQKYCGAEPVGWVSRVPNLQTRALLIRAGGFLYDCDSYDDDLPHWAETTNGRILTIPNTFDNSDQKFWPIPDNSGFTNPENLFNSLKDNLDRLHLEGENYPRILPISVSPRICGKPAKAQQLYKFLEYATNKEGVLFMTRGEIAKTWSKVLS